MWLSVVLHLERSHKGFFPRWFPLCFPRLRSYLAHRHLLLIHHITFLYPQETFITLATRVNHLYNFYFCPSTPLVTSSPPLCGRNLLRRIWRPVRRPPAETAWLHRASCSVMAACFHSLRPHWNLMNAHLTNWCSLGKLAHMKLAMQNHHFTHRWAYIEWENKHLTPPPGFYHCT